MRSRIRKSIVSLMMVLCLVAPTVAKAGGKTLSIDTTNASNGYINLQHSGDLSKKTVIKVDANGESYQYEVKTNSPFTIPLQMGSGTYKIMLLEVAQGNQYRVISNDSFEANITNSIGAFLKPNPIVDYAPNMKAIQGYQKQLVGKGDVVTPLYNDIISNYNYDHHKLNNVQAGYTPVLDEMYTLKEGICFDYASLTSGVLRSMNVPTRLVMGYVPEIEQYHAWNQVLMNGNWVTIDTTLDATYHQAGHETQMIKDTAGFRILKIY